jgi:hypothetical protein
MRSIRTFATALLLALAVGALPLLGADSVELVSLVIPDGTVHGPIGAITNGNFNGPALNAQNSVTATIKWHLESAATGQVFAQVFDQALESRGILGDQNVSKGSGQASVKFSLACTPGAPAASEVHTIAFGITRFGTPNTTLSKNHSVRYTFACPLPIMKVPTVVAIPVGTPHLVPTRP